jgi:hypothetical protein
MRTPWPLVFALTLCAAPAARAEPPKPNKLPLVLRDEQALARRVDKLVAAAWKERGVTPGRPADDGEFLRRAYLDLAGRVPRVAEARAFLDDPSPDKRRKLIDQLLDGPHYVTHLSNTWREVLLPGGGNNPQAPFFGSQLEAWLRRSFRDNAPYDRMVREVLTVPVAFNARGGQPLAAATAPLLAFYQANELKPENLAAATSRAFLGVKLECAQCHDHPFASWSRDQFWQFAAFFSGIQAPAANNGRLVAAAEKADSRELKVPDTDRVVRARFLDGGEPAWQEKVGTRATLAEWLTAAENPYFARAAANRVWAHLFGVGLVDPVDDLGADNPPSHPELLDELAGQFAAHQFDLKYLLRAVALSRAYQLSSDVTDPTQSDLRAFARMPLKGLTPEQLYDSLVVATGYRETNNTNNRFFGPRAEFLAKFNNATDRRTEAQTSILQALALMNGKFVADATSLERSEVLAAIADAPFLDDAQRVEALYLAALARKPRPEEVARLAPYVARGGVSGDPKKALTDVFWALLNSSEFILNH